MPKRQPHTGARKPGKQARVRDYVQAQAWERISGAEWEQLRSALPDISSTTMRTALAQMPLCFDQPFAGLDTKTLPGLETTLLEMASVYRTEPSLGLLCRNEVIAAKDRARFASQNANAAPEKRALKEEMLQWMLVWLGDPGLFASWVALRKRALTANQATLLGLSLLP